MDEDEKDERGQGLVRGAGSGWRALRKGSVEEGGGGSWSFNLDNLTGKHCTKGRRAEEANEGGRGRRGGGCSGDGD